MDRGDYVNGFVERRSGGKYEGSISVEGINLSPIEGVYFQKGLDTFLWIKRKPVTEYDPETETFKTRPSKPTFEAYLKKQPCDTIAYKGEFMFMRYKFSVVGVWDSILGKERQRLNLFVERLPMSDQPIINSIYERNRDGK